MTVTAAGVAGPAAQLLSRLDDEQGQAVTVAPGPVCIIAGAGTGKTTALVGRIAYQCLTGAWDPSAVLAVTHSTKAAGNMRDRLMRFGDDRLAAVTAKTFHAAALMLCRQYWDRTGREHDLQIADSPFPAVRAALRRSGMKDADVGVVTDIASEIAWAKATLVGSAGYARAAQAAHRSVNSFTPEQVAKVIARYDDELTKAGRVDFTDLLSIAVGLLNEHEDVARAVWGRYRHVLVDEFQDTDPAQDAFLRAVLGGRDDVTVVGDARQSIYAFKGASPGMLEQFASRFTDTRVVRLVRDYRSSPQIVAAANRLMATPAGEALVGCAADGPHPQLMTAQNEASEAAMVAAVIARELKSGTPASQIAVLYRFNAQSAPFESALGKLGIPYVVLDSERFFDRPEIRAVLRSAWGRMLAHEEQDDPEDPTFVAGLQLVRDALAEVGFDRSSPPSAAGAARDRWEAWNALLELVEGFPDVDDLPARVVMEELAHRRAESHGVTAQAVTLATLHKSKGLEWEVVVMPRMVEGSLPSVYATTDAEAREERRLAYVGLTRAARRMVFTMARMRGAGSRTWPAQPSRFLAELGLADAPAERTPRPRAKARGATGQPASGVKVRQADRTEVLESLSDEDRVLFEQLRAWRAAEAKVASLPTFVVFADAVLAEVAKRRPASRADLLKVPGIGLAKADKYGDALLKAVAAG